MCCLSLRCHNVYSFTCLHKFKQWKTLKVQSIMKPTKWHGIESGFKFSHFDIKIGIGPYKTIHCTHDEEDGHVIVSRDLNNWFGAGWRWIWLLLSMHGIKSLFTLDSMQSEYIVRQDVLREAEGKMPSVLTDVHIVLWMSVINTSTLASDESFFTCA